MSRFKVYLEYDGSRFSGWQKQQNAKTIQGTINKALKEIFKMINPIFREAEEPTAGFMQFARQLTLM